MDGKNIQLISALDNLSQKVTNTANISLSANTFRLTFGLEKLSHDRTVTNFAEKACNKLFKSNRNCSKVKTVTDSLFRSFYAWF